MIEKTLKIPPTLKMILIITVCFLLFSVSLLINIYADANSDVLTQRDKIDRMQLDLRNEKLLIETLESERDYWEDRLAVVESYLEERQDLEELARDEYEKALLNVVETVADIEFVEDIKQKWVDRQKEIVPAQNNVNVATKDFDDYEQRLADAKSKYRELLKLLPDEEDILDDLIVTANRAVPTGIYKDGTFQTIMISIILSDGCLVSDTCPNYLELANIYDNSNRYISGDFVEVDTKYTQPIYEMVICEGNCSTDSILQKVGEETITIWQRSKPLFAENTIEWYSYSTIPVMTFVDPDDPTRKKSKQIIIEPSMPEGFDRSLSKSIDTNSTTTWGVDRHINGCTSATIGWNTAGNYTGDELLADTWNYFYDNCSDELTFDTIVETYFPPTVFNDCHSWCEHLKWIESAKEVAKSFFADKVLR